MKKRIIETLLLATAAMMVMAGCSGDSGSHGNRRKHEDGYGSSKEVIEAFLEAYEDVDEDKMDSCIYEGTDSDDALEKNIENAERLEEYTTWYLDDIEFDKLDADDGDVTPEDWNYDDYDDYEYYNVMVPMEQESDGTTYYVEDYYDFYTVCIDGNWYVYQLKETDVEFEEVD